ncbi:MAG TPA: SRPBCC family protein [Chlorobaculum sp.]|nr:SRPBCC family protein [Chlorobaculum sp.]
MELNPDKTARLLQGEVLIELDWLPDGVIGASGNVFIKAGLPVVWQMLTDYDRLSQTMPKVVSSKLVEQQGPVKIIDQSGRSGIFIFETTVHFRLKVNEKYPKHLHFTQIGGDFKIYEGNWFLEAVDDQSRCGTILTYEAKIKPDFFAPQFLVSFVQSQDLPTILKGIRAFCQSGSQR